MRNHWGFGKVVAAALFLALVPSVLWSDTPKDRQGQQEQLVVELRSGGRIVGQPIRTTLRLESPESGPVDLPVAWFRTLELSSDGQARLLFGRGAREVRASVLERNLMLKAAWGEVWVPLSQVRRLAWLPADQARAGAEGAMRAAIASELNRAAFGAGGHDQPVRLVVALRDGSVLSGENHLRAVQLGRNAFGLDELLLRDLDRVCFGEGQQPDEVRTAGGGVLRCEAIISECALRTSFGPVSIAPEHVRTIIVLRPGAGPAQGTITIFNPGLERTDYQVRLVIPRAGDMRADCADLRFAMAASDGALPYWVEHAGEELAVVWVKLPRIPEGNTRVAMRWGNPTAQPVSNGEETFLFFDDFSEGFDAEKWERSRDASKGGCGAFVRDGVMHVYGGNEHALSWLQSRVDLPIQITVDGRWKLERKNRYAVGGLRLFPRNHQRPRSPTHPGIEYDYYFNEKSDRTHLMANRDSFAPTPLLTGVKLSPYWHKVWFRQRLSYDGTAAQRNLVIARDKGEGEEKLAHTVRRRDAPLRLCIHPWAWGAGPNHRFFIDWIAVRRYVPGPLDITVSVGDGSAPLTTVMDDGPPPDTPLAHSTGPLQARRRQGTH